MDSLEKTPFSKSRSAPKGRQQMRETGSCKNLRFSAVSCENLRFPAVFCANLRLPNPLIYWASRKSAKICKNLRKCAFRVRFLPFAVSLLARPELLKTPFSDPERKMHRLWRACVGCVRSGVRLLRGHWQRDVHRAGRSGGAGPSQIKHKLLLTDNILREGL